ncbi:MAG: DNA recombination/repair protein RecA [Chloroflexaceae bacterium]|nr:DNA recombination/repair protein RecA [Chloroflexaceae bacterium]
MERLPSTLDALIADLQRRYGAHAARRGSALRSPANPPTLATGRPALDAALPQGGAPRGRLTVIGGPRSAGVNTLAFGLIARAQAMGELACVLDAAHTFAPAAAAARGVALADLALARPADGPAAALTVATLLARRAVGVLVLDHLAAWLALPRGAMALRALLPRLPRLLAASGCALVVTEPLPTGLFTDASPPPRAPLAPLTSLRLTLALQGWVWHGPRIVGSRTRVTVLAPPFATPLATVTLHLPIASLEGQ